MFSIWYTSNATAALPIDSIGCLTVVSGGSVQFMGVAASGGLLPPDTAAWLRTVRR